MLSLMLLEHLVLTALPAAFVAFFAMRCGVRSVPLLLCTALAGSGIAAMLVFWAYYLTPLIGEATAFTLTLGSALGATALYREGLDHDLLRQLGPPAALWALGSAFVLYLGFLHGGTDLPIATPAARFSHGLPTDNDIPRYFADWFYANGHDGTPPLFGDWLSSDRPPLQIGYVLAQRPFGWDRAGLHYQVIGVVIQQLWIVGMWALLCAARLRPSARGLAIFAAMVSDVAIVHGFFVWPKLIAAAFLLAALALVVSDDWPLLRRSPLVAGVFGALLALSLLAHGASVFGVVPLLVIGALRGLPDWRWLGVAALVAAVLLAPWSAYQRFADPPGNRLIKWQIGGSLAIDGRGALETITDGYREVGVGGALDNKRQNIRQIIGWNDAKQGVRAAADEVSAGHFGRAVAALRSPRFFALLPFLGFLLLAPVAMVVARARRKLGGPEWRFSLLALGFSSLACLVWALLMFGGQESTTVIHTGSLVVPLVAVCGLVAGAWAAWPRFAIALVALNALFVLALYVPALSPQPGTSYSALAAALAAAALAGFGLIAFRQADA